ncbi:RGCVC family protein [Actinomycetospora cinnamomea]|uniref:RGCVC family protein n=1 Tax=Actinomycetospora cinnamomea TaxID=663609 RepID=UPI000E316390|nr:RGCVC family protein [Actinomycetospora cinnamomea]
MSATEAPTVTTEHDAKTSCTVCPHAWSAHDALGRRFCTATRDVRWSRGCICPALTLRGT